MKKSLTILICYRNEEHNIVLSGKAMIKALRKNSIKYKIIFYNDGSNDNSEKNVKKNFNKNCYFYSNKKSMGIRYMYKKMIKLVNTEYFSIMSGNNNFKTEDYNKLFSKIKKNKKMIVHYIPNSVEKRGFTRSMISQIFIWLMRTIFQKNILYFTGQNIYSTKLLKKFNPTYKYSIFQVQMFLNSLSKIKNNEFEICKTNFHKRISGRTKSININKIIEIINFLWKKNLS